MSEGTAADSRTEEQLPEVRSSLSITQESISERLLHRPLQFQEIVLT